MLRIKPSEVLYYTHKKMFDDPTELQAMLDEAAGNLRVKPRTASLDDAHTNYWKKIHL
jgi:hypothetical protein